MTTPTPARRAERVEAAVQISILLLIGGMAGAASFTHVHDWTMANSPKGTGDWFGWANAVISELTPTAAGLEIRRRKRQHQNIWYPMAVLIAAAILSVAALPALAFLALSKLVLSRTTPTIDALPADQAPTLHVSTHRPAIEYHHAPEPQIPAEILTGARMAAHSHHHTTGRPITTTELADHLRIPPDLAAAVLSALDDTPAGDRP